MSTPKSKFDGLFQKEPESEAAPERVEKAAPTIVPAGPPPGPPLPTAMNFKLSRGQAEALRRVQYETGKTKQRVVSDALDEWIAKYIPG